MIQDRLSAELEEVASRYRRLWSWQAHATALLVGACIALGIRATGLSFIQNSQVYTTLLISLLAVTILSTIFRTRTRFVNLGWLARQIEARHPDLNSCLLAAVEQNPTLSDGRFGFLQLNVIEQAVTHAVKHDWRDVVSRRRLVLAAVANMATLTMFIWAVTFTPRIALNSVTKYQKDKRAQAAAGELAVMIEPGDTEIERGSSLLVLARVTGPMPADATLITQPTGSEATRLAMSASLDDPIFGGRVPAVLQPLEYRVELAGHVTPTYHVTVFEYPRLERADARLVYPGYTGLETRLIQDVRTASVVEGTEVTLICNLNKSVKSATLTEANNSPLVLAAPVLDKPIYQVTFRGVKTRRLRLELIDEAGRHNTEQVQIVVQVVPNQPPTLKLVAPGKDLEVSPLEELDLKATAWDDYGVKRMGVSYGLAGQPPTDVVLGENAAARQKHELANLIRFEELQAKPDQLLAYHFWAEDFGPDGKLRRTSSDMYFAEVRHFDEIFREGQQPPGGQRQQQGGGQNAQAAQQLAQLQKDIINATWKLIRREIDPQPTATFVEDVKQIADSQTAALEQADALNENIRDMQSQAHLLAVLEAMQAAIKQLQAAHDKPATSPLQPALAAEQSAYQGLLKLRAREHEVIRQQQQQSSSSSSSQAARSQQQRQQMQQLDLKDEENRYETQRLAQAQQENPEDRETRQVLNRLKELARRQHDLNERLKDLQSALQEAQNEQKKEEIRQQLKRLQDEQRDVLRDTDELQTRMETPENQERMAEERQQLEQARDQVRKSSESLEKDQVTQAAAAGTRAEREFDELRNEFRRRASGRFNEELREMRDAARDLDQQEKKLSHELAETGQPDPSKKSLRDDNRIEEIAQGLNEQKSKLSTLTERLKQTVQEAEQTEPLLSERLHDAARNLQDQKVERALEATEQSIRRGLLDDARQIEQIAGRGIGQLKEGIEKAAESVLGDETEALRRAREQLKNLAQELNQEIARNAPEEAPQTTPGREPNEQTGARTGNGEPQEDQPRDPNQATSGERPNGTGQPPGERKPGEGQPGELQPGEAQNGERQPGQPQAGERQPGETPPQEGRPGQQPGANPQAGPRPPVQRGQGQRPPGEQQPGESPNGDQPGEAPSDQPAEGQSPMPGQGQGQGQGQPQPGQRPQTDSPQADQPGRGGQPGQQNQAGQPNQSQQGQQPMPGSPQPGQRNGQPGARRQSNPNGLGGGGILNQEIGPVTAPISGGDFLNWSDRLRDVEEMVDDPELRAEAARIRDAARSIRAETKRHSKEPNWKLVRVNVAEPLAELANRVSDELLRRNSKQAIVPLDRDPVPPKYSEKTRRYYERLGSDK